MVVRSRARWWLAIVAVLSMVLAVVPAASAEDMPGMPPLPAGAKVVASGLNAPRKLVADPWGNLIVTEVGMAPDPDHQGTPNGRILKISPDGTVTPWISGIPTVGFEGESAGLADVQLWDDTLYWVGLAHDIPTSGESKYIMALGPDGTSLQVADLGMFEKLNDPDRIHNADGTTTPKIDSDPYGIAFDGDGDLWAVDAGGNDVLRIDKSGNVQLMAFFAPLMIPGVPFPVDAVPTGITPGPDGAIYVSFLTGFPFVPGQSWISRIDDAGHVTTVAKGLTLTDDLAMGPDGMLYAVTIFDDFGFDANNPDAPPNPKPGRIVRINPEDGTMTTVVEGIFAAGGVAFDAEGNMYATAFTVGPPNSGMVLEWDNVAPPVSWMMSYWVTHGHPPPMK